MQATNRIIQDKEIIIARAVIEEIRKSSQEVIDELSQGININNIDEVSVSLHNEGSRSAKILLSALNKIQKAIEDQSNVLSKISKENAQELRNDIKESKVEEVTIKNLSEITLPEEINIGNFQELMYWFKKVEDAIKAIDINPVINVSQPEIRVKVPPAILNAPVTDLGLVEDYLRIGLKKLKDNNKSNPMFVRMTDLETIINKLEEIKEASKNVMLGFPGALRIQNATGGVVDFNTIGIAIPTVVGSGKKTVTTAGTNVVLAASQTIKSVTIKALTANTGTIYVGDSTVASTNGFQLSANDSVSLEFSNLANINLDSSVNGEGVTYMWVN